MDTGTEDLARRHMANWDMETADPRTVRIMRDSARVDLAHARYVLGLFTQEGLAPPDDLRARLDAEIALWDAYIAWAEPILAFWDARRQEAMTDADS